MNKAWTGYSDAIVERTWNWRLTGTTGAYTTYTNWKSGEPNNQGNEDCSAIQTDSGKWNDEQCGLKMPSVCEYGKEILICLFEKKVWSPISSTKEWYDVGWNKFS